MNKPPSEARGAKGQHKLHDFQLFDAPRLEALRAKEAAALEHKAAARKSRGGAEEGGEDGADAEPAGLSRAEELEKAELIRAGFADWNRKDLNAFVRGCELHGRSNVRAVAAEVEGKSEHEVARYASAFFRKYEQIDNWDKLLKRIEVRETRRAEPPRRAREHPPAVTRQTRPRAAAPQRHRNTATPRRAVLWLVMSLRSFARLRITRLREDAPPRLPARAPPRAPGGRGAHPAAHRDRAGARVQGAAVQEPVDQPLAELRRAEGQALQRGGGPLSDLHDAPARLRPLGGAARGGAQVLALPLRLVYQDALAARAAAARGRAHPAH